MGDPLAPINLQAPVTPPVTPTLTPTAPKLGTSVKAPSNPLADLGQSLFGQNNGSLFGGVPALGDLARAAGNIPGGVGELAIKPVELTTGIVSHIPLGWVPGGSDQQFRTIGDFQKQSDPIAYKQWQLVNAHANGDILGGGNLKSDYVREQGLRYADMTPGGISGPLAGTPSLAFGPSGSLGGWIADLITGMGVPSANIQNFISQNRMTKTGLPVPQPGDFKNTADYLRATGEYQTNQGPYAQVDRVTAIEQRAQSGQPLNEVEKMVVQHLQDGSWTRDHALNFVIAANQGLSREFAPQMLGMIATDPLTYLTLGAAGLAQAGKVGLGVKAATEVGYEATNLEKAAVVLSDVQNSALKPVFTVARGVIDPFTLVGKMSGGRAAVDLLASSTTKAVERAYGQVAYNSLFRTFTERGLGPDLQRALGVFTGNMARKYVIVAHRAASLASDGMGEQLAHIAPDSVVGDLMKTSEKDVVTRITDFIARKKSLFTSAEDDQMLTRRLAVAFGGDTATWAETVAKMSADEKSLTHAATYSKSWTDFQQAIHATEDAGGMKWDPSRLVILNDNQLDNVAAQVLRAELESAGRTTELTTSEFAAIWNKAADKWGDIADLGRASLSKVEQNKLLETLTELIDSGSLHTRITPDELVGPEYNALRDFFDKANVGGTQVWNLGFAPDPAYAWGLRRDGATGLLRVSGDPFVSNITEWTDATRPVSEVTRNIVGQVFGGRGGAVAGKVADAMEVAWKTGTDVISSQRVLNNMEQRFVVNMSGVGVGPGVSRDLFRAAREAAELQRTTIQGVHPQNVWSAVEKVIPSDLVDVVNQRVLMNALLDASGGDLRIMGITSGLTQRVRTAALARGLDPGSLLGEATVNMYRTLRYTLNPTFYIQKITDGAYFNILAGIRPVGSKPFEVGSKMWEMQQILETMGSTALARDFGLDMPEYQFMSSFQQRLRDRLGELAGPAKFEAATRAGSRWQANNMVANFSHRVGNIVDESLKEAQAAMVARSYDPALTAAERADAANAASTMWHDVGQLQGHYGKAAGRILTPDEAGLKYLQEIFHDQLGQTITKDGLLTFRHDILDGVYHKPARVGEVQSLKLDRLAADLGYIDDRTGLGDIAALRKDVREGNKSIEWLQEQLRETYNADPGYAERVTKAINFDYNQFWKDTRLTLDLSKQETARLEGILAREARMRGMNPSEYLSEVLDLNLGRVAKGDHVAKILKVVKAGMKGTKEQQVKSLADIFVHSIDPSAQRVLINQYRADLPRLIREARKAGNTALADELQATHDSLQGVINGPEGSALNGIPMTYEEYIAQYPGRPISVRYMARSSDVSQTEGDMTRRLYFRSSVGDGVVSLPEEQQRLLFHSIGKLRAQFPDVPLEHFDIASGFAVPVDQGGFGFRKGWAGVTMGYSSAETTILLNDNAWGANFDAYWESAGRNDAAWKTYTSEGLQRVGHAGRRSPVGVPYVSGAGPSALLTHEMGHAVDENIRLRLPGQDIGATTAPSAARIKEGKLAQAFVDLVDEGYNTPEILHHVSEYAHDNVHEFSAEVFNLVVNPESRPGYASLPFEVHQFIEDYRQALLGTGLYRPMAAPDLSVLDAQLGAKASDHFAGQVLDRLQSGRKAADPNVEAVTQYFAKWAKEVYAQEFASNRSAIGNLLRGEMGSIPTNNAVPYSRTEALVEQILKQKIEYAQRDAFRLAEMSSQRNMASRTLNHPVFGLYPTSYMWNKVLPEMTKFIALKPFGIDTGLLAYQMARAEQSIATQREYDPKFASGWDKLASSETAFLLDYLTPSLPWSDMRAGAPPWLASIQKNGFDIMKALDAETATVTPQRWYRSFVKSSGEISDATQGAVEGLTNPEPPKLQQLDQTLTPQATPTPTPRPTGAVGQLQPALTDSLTQLQNMFGAP